MERWTKTLLLPTLGLALSLVPARAYAGTADFGDTGDSDENETIDFLNVETTYDNTIPLPEDRNFFPIDPDSPQTRNPDGTYADDAFVPHDPNGPYATSDRVTPEVIDSLSTNAELADTFASMPGQTDVLGELRNGGRLIIDKETGEVQGLEVPGRGYPLTREQIDALNTALRPEVGETYTMGDGTQAVMTENGPFVEGQGYVPSNGTGIARASGPPVPPGFYGEDPALAQNTPNGEVPLPQPKPDLIANGIPGDPFGFNAADQIATTNGDANPLFDDGNGGNPTYPGMPAGWQIPMVIPEGYTLNDDAYQQAAGVPDNEPTPGGNDGQRQQPPKTGDPAPFNPFGATQVAAGESPGRGTTSGGPQGGAVNYNTLSDAQKLAMREAAGRNYNAGLDAPADLAAGSPDWSPIHQMQGQIVEGSDASKLAARKQNKMMQFLNWLGAAQYLDKKLAGQALKTSNDKFGVPDGLALSESANMYDGGRADPLATVAINDQAVSAFGTAVILPEGDPRRNTSVCADPGTCS